MSDPVETRRRSKIFINYFTFYVTFVLITININSKRKFLSYPEGFRINMDFF